MRAANRMANDLMLGAIVLSVGLIPATVAGQEPDRLLRDSAVTVEPIEVHSIAPAAHPAVGSGLPARLSVFGRQAIDAWQPRLAADMLARQRQAEKQNKPEAGSGGSLLGPGAGKEA